MKGNNGIFYSITLISSREKERSSFEDQMLN